MPNGGSELSEPRRGVLSRVASVQRDGLMIWAALAALVITCAIFASSTLTSTALLSMLPFAAILAIASIGQCLTIQQGGLDFSVIGSISLAAAIVAGHPSGHDSELLSAILMALGAVSIAGLLNGIAISVLRITPIIATLAVNALLLGAVQSYTKGIPRQATSNISDFAVGKFLGVPNTVWIAAVFVAVASLILSRTVVGRRAVAIGANPETARAAGLRVSHYVIGTYVTAALCYGVAGIVLAGYLQTPGIEAGKPYLFSTITAVVLGGTALGGGRGRIVGTAAAALFLGQLESFLSSIGAPPSVSLLVQAAAIAIAVAFSQASALASLPGIVRNLRPLRQPSTSREAEA